MPDDMYFVNWFKLYSKKINHKNFYLSMTHISHKGGVKGDIQHNKYVVDLIIVDENKLLKNFKNFDFRNLQGSHWAPH